MTCAFRYLLQGLDTIAGTTGFETARVPERAAGYMADTSALEMWSVVGLAVAVPMLVMCAVLELEARYRKRLAEARIREAEARTREADADLARSRADLVGLLAARVEDVEHYKPSDAVVIAVISQGSPAVSELQEAPIVALPAIGSKR